MTKPFQFVALALIGAVLAGGQCAELCALVACDQPTAVEVSMPCHRHPAPKKTPDPACVHREIVAEKQAGTSLLTMAPTVSLVANLTEPLPSPELSRVSRSLGASLPPPPHRPDLLTVLRI